MIICRSSRTSFQSSHLCSTSSHVVNNSLPCEWSRTFFSSSSFLFSDSLRQNPRVGGFLRQTMKIKTELLYICDKTQRQNHKMDTNYSFKVKYISCGTGGKFILFIVSFCLANKKKEHNRISAAKRLFNPLCYF